ncbi:MAG: carotenoid oxygenase family protein [Natrialbaceae archaeon]|nr:carotenoid oxygenase family protein [Natrialbaceae archaeon]
MLLSNKPFIEHYNWHPEQPVQFTVLDRETGEVVSRSEADPFFAFHHVNAFESGDEIVLDCSTYPDASVLDDLYLDDLRAENSTFETLAESELRRYRVPIDGGVAEGETLYSGGYDLPAIHYREYNTRPYEYAYGLSSNENRSDDFSTSSSR